MKISVALCTFNGEKYLQQQIDSILHQTVKVDEIVVCDDGSNDATLQILKEYHAQFPEIFRIYSNEKNLRSVKNFEKAISLCTGEIIFLSDQDDIWEEVKVEMYVDHFKQHPKIDVICSNGYLIDDSNNTLEKYTVWDVPQILNSSNLDYFKIFCTIGNFATGASMAIKKSFVEKVLPFPLIDGFHHDEWIAVIASEENRFDFINDKLFRYRIHSEQQVGGISYPKDEKSKEKMIQKFDVNREPKSFREYKIKLRTFNDKEKKFREYLQNNPNTTIERLLAYIQTQHALLKRKIKSEKPLLSFIFNFLYR
ncbi:glycosyltransferase family 2 protein [Chryseobacterium gwangjuense]|uniref:glycosyltransferase family 2 protein n=1 Tax=Chryseobacterium gwangjuense TaxID=1069980 RepID=UPI001E2FB541|nr:glycosyltransferase family 2 protein [Chryseobacterium gwangjuense]MCE3077234.1 glycosyltransferase family 2 protein [Chryseobacterium gwangjuense]